MLADAQRQEVLALARKLIQTSSLTAQEGGAVALATEAMKNLGYHEVHVDEWGNLVGIVRGTGTGSVLFDAHLDTVPYDQAGWTHDPLGGQVAEGKLWGRGASDMKGAAAAAIWGVGQLANDPGGIGTVYVCLTVCEEPAEGPMLVKVCEQFRPRAVVIGEASQCNINIGQRGRAELVVETLGKPAHSSRPDLGVNAVKGMARLIGAIEALQLPTDELLGSAVLEVTDVVSTPYPGLSVVPYRCRATFDRRLLVAETPDAVVGQVAEAADRLGIQANVSLAESDLVTWTGKRFSHRAFSPAWKTPRESKLVAEALAALQAAGQAPGLSKYSFCTNGSGSAGWLSVPTIGYGPGREEEAHIIDEFLELEQLYRAAEGYMALARALSR